MKILLFALNSSYGHTNLAVRCIKSSLCSAGFNCSILERSLKDRRDSILRELYLAEADYYGFSTYIWNADELYRYAAALKKLRPASEIVFGGPEVSFSGDEFFYEHPYVDYIIRGEGEAAWVNLCGGHIGDKIIDGTAFDGFTDADIHYDRAHDGSIVYYESSRGCPFRCAFCLSGISGGVRAKTVEKTLSDLLEFEKIGSVKIVKFVDRTFNFDCQRAKAIWLGLLGEQYTLNYHFEICASLLDKEAFDILSRFPNGKIQLEIGVQSTNPPTLEVCGRRNDSLMAIEAAERIREFGNIHVHCDLIAGLPYESYRRFAQSFDDLYGRCDMLQLGFLKLLRGSVLRDRAEELGIVFDPAPPYTVLSTPNISFNELCGLRSIAAVMERFENGSFARTIAHITKKIGSPFNFYEGLAAFIDSSCDNNSGIAGISQSTARELFYQYSVGYSENGVAVLDEAVFRACMRFDYLLNEVRTVPDYLRSDFDDKNVCAAAFRQYSQCNRDKLFLPASEAHLFEFDPEQIYIIDRRGGRYVTLPPQSPS